jgi:predicted dehydrogenase
MYRFHPQIDRLCALIAGGALGPLRWLRGSFTYTLADPGDVRWDAKLGGGALYDLGCYPLNLMRMVTQAEPTVLSVASRLTAPAADGGRVDHAAHSVMRFDLPQGPALGHLDSAFTLPFHCHFEALCEKTLLRLTVPFTSKGVDTELRVGDYTEHFTACDPYALMAAHFEAAARGECALRFSLDDSVAQARALDALLAQAHATPID